MSNMVIEMKKSRRSGVIEVLPAVGVLGMIYVFANFAVRKDTLLNLPLPPMVVLLTQLYGMLMILNMFGIIVAVTLTYNIEFTGNALKKMYMLPFCTSGIFKNKFIMLLIALVVCFVFQNVALTAIGIMFLPEGSFEILSLLKYAVYSFSSTLPVLGFMLLIASRLENIWITLGVGVAGFFSGMAMATVQVPIFLVNPFVLMMKPAMETGVDVNFSVLLLSIIETIVFYVIGWLLAKNKHYE